MAVTRRSCAAQSHLLFETCVYYSLPLLGPGRGAQTSIPIFTLRLIVFDLMYSRVCCTYFMPALIRYDSLCPGPTRFLYIQLPPMRMLAVRFKWFPSWIIIRLIQCIRKTKINTDQWENIVPLCYVWGNFIVFCFLMKVYINIINDYGTRYL